MTKIGIVVAVAVVCLGNGCGGGEGADPQAGSGTGGVGGEGAGDSGGSGGAVAGSATGGATASVGGAVASGGQPQSPEIAVAQRVAVGVRFACVVTASRTIECWGVGYDSADQASGDGWDAVWAAEYGICASKTDGTIWCWGPFGLINPEGSYFSPSGDGNDYICALRSDDGGVECWGEADQIPEIPDATATFAQLLCSGEYCCGLDAATGNLSCWGSADAATVGLTDSPAGEFARLTGGGTINCAISTTGEISCWGGVACVQNTPTGAYRAVSSGGCDACAIDLTGELVCWGNGMAGGEVPAGTFVEVANGDDAACAIGSDGSVSCWGNLADVPSGLVALVD